MSLAHLLECPGSPVPPWARVSPDPAGCGGEGLMRAGSLLPASALPAAGTRGGRDDPNPLAPCRACQAFSSPWGCPPSLPQSGAG